MDREIYMDRQIINRQNDTWIYRYKEKQQTDKNTVLGIQSDK